MRPAEVQRILLEALAVAIVGAGIALTANALSPRGLALNRDYFPKHAARLDGPRPTPPPLAAATNDPIAERLKSKGLACIRLEETRRLQSDPQTVFIDARDEEKFEAGHLRGAYQLDPYHPETSFGKVLPACMAAGKIVVYCAGGECEDADTVGIMLRDAGVAADKIVVYGGGMDEWTAQHEPAETGARP